MIDRQSTRCPRQTPDWRRAAFPAWTPDAQVHAIRCLLDAGAEVNARDKKGASPLHRAVRTRCAAAVDCLLSAGANRLAGNNAGATPFHPAVQDTGRGGSGEPMAREAQRQIIDTFLSIGLGVGLKDGKGQSVLDCAKSAWVRDLLTGPAR